MTNRAQFRSGNDIALVTQELTNKPMLTVENSNDWYALYLINTDGKVEEIGQDTNPISAELMWLYWHENCIDPVGFKKVAKKLNADYDQATYDSVCRRFEQEHLKSAKVYK